MADPVDVKYEFNCGCEWSGGMLHPCAEHAKRRPMFRKPNRKKNTLDSRGTVKIQLWLMDPETKCAKRGNITQSYTIHDVTVGEVSESLAEFLFANGESETDDTERVPEAEAGGRAEAAQPDGPSDNNAGQD